MRPAAKVHAGKIISAIQFKSLPDKGELKGAYAEVHKAAAAEAAEALQQQEIPPAMKAQVRDYFDSIKPEGKRK